MIKKLFAVLTATLLPVGVMAADITLPGPADFGLSTTNVTTAITAILGIAVVAWALFWIYRKTTRNVGKA